MSRREGWGEAELGELFRLATEGCMPAALPDEEFVHHSLPAFDDLGGPVRQIGREIESNKTAIRRPCVMVSKLNPRIPRVSLVEDVPAGERHCASTEFMVYEPLSDQLDLRFFMRLLSAPAYHMRLNAVATGTTNSHVRVRPSETLTWAVPVPPAAEQRHIADILDAIDAAIRSTERLIAKLEAMKDGVVHDVLTRGVDEGGALRNPTREPERFGDTVLGRLPLVWSVETLGVLLSSPGAFVQTGPFGSQLHADEYVENGTPVVMPQDLVGGEIGTDRIVRVASATAERLARHRLRVGDVIFARRGDLSKCAPVRPEHKNWLCGTGCLLVRPPSEVVRADWLAVVYRHAMSQRQIQARAVGSTMVNLNSSLIRGLHLAIPSRTEQDSICAIVAAHQRRVAAAGSELAKIRLLRRALMEDLLTGRVRVNVGTEESA